MSDDEDFDPIAYMAEIGKIVGVIDDDLRLRYFLAPIVPPGSYVMAPYVAAEMLRQEAKRDASPYC